MPRRGDPKSQSWWTTLPGILTGVAAVITAIGGLMVAYHQGSNRNNPTEDSSSRSAASSPIANSVAGSAGTSSAVSPSGGLPLPAISEVKLDSGNTVVRILKVELQPYNAEKRSLKFTVRHTNNGRYPANFWGSSYRLLVDDVPQAPANFLDEVVPDGSAKTGEVIFEIPTTLTQVILQISSGAEKTQIPVPLAAR